MKIEFGNYDEDNKRNRKYGFGIYCWYHTHSYCKDIMEWEYHTHIIIDFFKWYLEFTWGE